MVVLFVKLGDGLIGIVSGRYGSFLLCVFLIRFALEFGKGLEVVVIVVL